MAKETVFEYISAAEEQLVDAGRQLWENPELGLHEEQAADLLAGILADAGFDIERGIGDMPTAFAARYGDGGPTIGILGEYDALPGLSQEVAAEERPVEPGGPGHGCGHNLFGTAGVGAALGLKAAIDAGELSGTVVFYGCPAEETLIGKVYMARAGAFDELDAAITWHPGDLSTPTLAASNALNSLQFTFEGAAAHAAGSPESGRSALDAVQLLNTGVEYMREHIADDARVHYSIVEGGDAPNVVPAEATVWYYVRGPERDQVERNTAWLRDIADAAAQMTRTEVSERFLTGCYDFQANEAITGSIWENMQAVGEVPFDDADHELAASIQATVPDTDIEDRLEDVPEEFAAEIRKRALYPTPIPAYDADIQNHGSTEVGDVSWIVPTGQFRLASRPVGAPGHSWQVTAANGDFGLKAIVPAAKVLGGTAYDLMSDPDALAAAVAEFDSEIGADAYETPLPPEAEPPFDVTADTDA